MPRHLLALTAGLVLAGLAPATDGVRLDLFGDPLPAGARARLGSVRFRVPEHAVGLRYLPDGKTLLVACGEERADFVTALYLFDKDSGRLLHRRPVRLGLLVRFRARGWQRRLPRGTEHDAPAWDLSPDGRLLAETFGTGSVRVRDLFRDKVVLDLPRAGRHVHALRFTPDSKHLAALDDPPPGEESDGMGKTCRLRVWNLAGREVRTFAAPADARTQEGVIPERFLFSRDGRSFAAAADPSDKGEIYLWDWDRPDKPRRLHGHDCTQSPIAISPDSKCLAEVSSGWLRLWDVATGKQVRRLAECPEVCTALEFAPDGRHLVAADAHGQRREWDLATGKAVLVAGAQVFSPDGRFRAICTNKDLYVSKVATGARLFESAGDFTDRSGVRRSARVALGAPVAFAPDGRSVAAATSRALIRRWSVPDGKELPPPGGNRAPTDVLALSPDGKRLVTGGAAGASLWDASTGRHLTFLARVHGVSAQADAGHTVTRVAYADDGKHVAAGWDYGAVSVWQADTGRQLWTKQKHPSTVSALAFADDGLLASSGAEEGRVVWSDAATGRTVRTVDISLPIDGQLHRANVLDFGPGARVVSAATRVGGNRLCETATGKVRHALPIPAGSLRFALDGRLALAQGSYRLQLWDVAEGRELRGFAQGGDAGDAVLSPDARLVAGIGSGGTVRVWSAATETVLADLPRHGGAHAVAFAPDGQTLATAESDTTVLLWDTQEHALQVTAGAKPDRAAQASAGAEHLLALRPRRLGSLAFQHSAAVGGLRYLPDGKTLLTDTDADPYRHEQRTLELWDATTGVSRGRLAVRLAAYQEMLIDDGNQQWLVNSLPWCVAQDGRLLATVEDMDAGQSLRVRALPSGKVLFEWPTEAGKTANPQFAPDGKLLAVLHRDKKRSVCLLDSVSGRFVRRLEPPAAANDFDTAWYEFAPDSRRLVAVEPGNRALIWDLAGWP
jgi:WD40 repeat protein